jgi:hypothetical protein
MKILSPEEFYKKTGVGLVTIGEFKRTSRSDWIIYHNTFKKYKCGCGKKHTFTSTYTKVHWHESGIVNINKLILQEPGCEFINFIELEGVFIIDFKTLYSTNILEDKGVSDYVKASKEYYAPRDNLFMSKAKLMCLDCKIKYPFKNININKKATIFMPALPRAPGSYSMATGKSLEPENLDVKIIICLNCKKVTSFATDLDDASGKAIDSVEYFRIYKLPGYLKKQVLDYEKEKKAYLDLSVTNTKIYLSKINKIKNFK